MKVTKTETKCCIHDIDETCNIKLTVTEKRKKIARNSDETEKIR